MASDTNTKKTRPSRSSFDKLIDLYWGGTERRISGLTLRIIGINAISLLVLMLGILNLGRYETEILTGKLETFQKETTIIANALAGNDLTQDTLPATIQNLKTITGHDIILFSPDSTTLAQTINPLEITSIIPPKRESISLGTLKTMADWVIKLAPNRKELPFYPKSTNALTDIKAALNGQISLTAWQTDANDIILSGAAPITANGAITGSVYVLRSGHDIVSDISQFWGQMLQIFLITLAVTFLISIYLSGTISRPLRRLARAAEAIRRTDTKTIEIPDLSDRYDEIGELSLVMRDMTETLWSRLNAIETFAADVSHELKNPLTSLKSAVETLKIVKKKKDQDALLKVLEHDIERMDRLITDIAATSRLDVELSRQTTQIINLNTLLEATTQRHTAQSPINITLNLPAHDVQVRALSDRLIQVLDNLIVNALSFAEAQDTITITATETNKTAIITISDQGPGIPDNKLKTIFDRFYSERPETESFGRHSGLGLAICKQIMEALGGSITATNITNEKGATKGARFTVILNKA